MDRERRVLQSVDSNSYSNLVGFVFIFNLIVGTGALTLPGAFAKAGWCLSLVVLVLLAIFSYITVTFVIEVMACANAIKTWQNLHALRQDQVLNESEDVNVETVPLTIENVELQYYQLNQKFELGEMATIFFNDFGRILFYLCFIVYLYGDLSIYSAAVSRSLRDVICETGPSTNTSNISIFITNYPYLHDEFPNKKNDECWQHSTLSVTRKAMYRVILFSFTLIFGPFVICSIQKTKYLQILTALFRWMAFALMICIAIRMIATDGAQGHPAAISLYGIPSLFGACVYSFMCHHSLPGLMAPLKTKSIVNRILVFDYILICSFYIVLAMTGIFAFDRVQDLYTLNFIPRNGIVSPLLIVTEYFLSLFPVFTLSTSYPLIAITLKNNLQALCLHMSRYGSYNNLINLLFPILTVMPPFCIAFFTENLSILVAFTGSYAGVGIQYIIPAMLVYFSRKTCLELLGTGIINKFRSPFQSNAWLALIITWSMVSVLLVSFNLLS